MGRSVGIFFLLIASAGMSLAAQAASDAPPAGDAPSATITATPSDAAPAVDAATPSAENPGAVVAATGPASPPVAVAAPAAARPGAKAAGFALGVRAGPVFHLATELIPLMDPGIALSLECEYRFPGAASFLLMGDIGLLDAPFPGGNSLAWAESRLGAGVAFTLLPWLDLAAFAKAGTYVGILGAAVIGSPAAAPFGMLSASVGLRLDFDLNGSFKASLAVQGDYCMYVGYLLRAALGGSLRL